jgi:hypothetical protein
MGWLRILAVGGAALAMSGTLARAADMPAYPPPPADNPILVDINSGWYLRGDVRAHWGCSPAPICLRRIPNRPTAAWARA